MHVAYSPDGRYAYVVLAVNEDWSPPYLDDTLCKRVGDGWLGTISSGAGGVHWMSTDESDGVLSLIGEAPPDATAAVVAWLGREHEAPVAAGHFFFVAWDVPDDHPYPGLVRFVGHGPDRP